MRLIIYLTIFIALCFLSLGASWTGRAENELVGKWGPPDIQVQNANGNTVLIYNITTSQTYNRQYSPAIGVSQRGVVVVTPPSNPYLLPDDLKLICHAQFEVNKRGIIVSSRMSGAGCDAI